MSQTAVEILIESQARAREVLKTALDGAVAALAVSNKQAAEKLSSEQQQAQAVFWQKHARAQTVGSDVRETAEQMPHDDSEEYLAQQGTQADDLLADNERIARDLKKAQDELAQRRDENMDTRARDLLMQGHREAAAILLQARMRVEEEQQTRR